MTEPLVINGRKMLTSHEAADLSGWSQDYISILCRKGTVPSFRTPSCWLIDETALLAHIKEKHFKSAANRPDSRTINGKYMISARAAAKVARCTQDYVTRLAREGKIVAIQNPRPLVYRRPQLPPISS